MSLSQLVSRYLAEPDEDTQDGPVPPAAVQYTYKTGPWLARLKRSFKTEQAARQQCERDWRRLDLSDQRSYRQQASDYLFGNELLYHFANQAVFARPYRLLMRAFSDGIVTQNSCDDLKLVLNRDRSIEFEKSFIVWPRNTCLNEAEPLCRVKIHLNICEETVTVTFSCL